MKRKPWSLVILALLHIIAPFGNMLLNALRAGRTLPQQWHYWFDVLPKYLLFIYIAVPIMAGIFIFVCRRWSYWAYLGCLAVIFLSNLYSFWTSMNVNTLLLLVLVVVVDLLVVAYFVVPSVQKVYFDPRMRWWEAAPRYNFNHEGLINGTKAFIKNLSPGGMLYTTGPSLKEGDKVEATFQFEGKDYKVSGQVVYKNPNAPGYGVKFEHTSETQKQMKQVTDRLHEQKLIVVERLPGPEDSFGVWLKKLVTRGEGLFPKARS
ncbi:PilZ domain-containing protein [Bdellovibrio sp. 22V]|uniref:PilZ domain-containing protein n=1 Tax=Bdellovibrio TaxID=958 RepID=UPI002542F3D7|nr:PilZ domain-containing protein [Bdellovibrio sp. 22V]WII72880.1 PilZ domain-containing protein [Bdellovibrio sp. 22V]